LQRVQQVVHAGVDARRAVNVKLCRFRRHQPRLRAASAGIARPLYLESGAFAVRSWTAPPYLNPAARQCNSARHHGVDGVPPERTVDPAVISVGAPGELAQPPAIRERCPLPYRYDSARQGELLRRFWDGEAADSLLRGLCHPRFNKISAFRCSERRGCPCSARRSYSRRILNNPRRSPTPEPGAP
jgi:hypothetical protein